MPCHGNFERVFFGFIFHSEPLGDGPKKEKWKCQHMGAVTRALVLVNHNLFNKGACSIIWQLQVRVHSAQRPFVCDMTHWYVTRPIHTRRVSSFTRDETHPRLRYMYTVRQGHRHFCVENSEDI